MTNIRAYRTEYDAISAAIVENLDNGFGLDFADNGHGDYCELVQYSVDFGENAGYGVMAVDYLGHKTFYHVESDNVEAGTRLFAKVCAVYL